MNQLVELYKEQSNVDLLNLPVSHKAFFYNFLKEIPSALPNERFKDLEEIVSIVLTTHPELKTTSSTYDRNLAAFLCESTRLPGDLVIKIIKENKLNFAASSSMDKGDFQSFLLGRKPTNISRPKRKINPKEIDFYVSRLEIAYNAGFKHNPKPKEIEEVMYGFSSMYIGNMSKLEDYLTILIEKGFVASDEHIDKILLKCTNKEVTNKIIPLLEKHDVLKFGFNEPTLKNFIAKQIGSHSEKANFYEYAEKIDSLNILAENKKILRCVSVIEYIKEVGRYIAESDISKFKQKSFNLMEDCLKLNTEERQIVLDKIKAFKDDPNFINKGKLHEFIDEIFINFVENQKAMLLASIELVENTKKPTKRI